MFPNGAVILCNVDEKGGIKEGEEGERGRGEKGREKFNQERIIVT